MRLDAFVTLLQSFHVVEYSAAQGAYHIDDLYTSVRDNLDSVISGATPDYVAIGVFPSYEMASAWVERERASGNLPDAPPRAAGAR